MNVAQARRQIAAKTKVSGYIAYAAKGKAIWGIGGTLDDSVKDAHAWQRRSGCLDGLIVVPATKALLNAVHISGAAKITWTLWRDVAMLQLEARTVYDIEADVRRAEMLERGRQLIEADRRANAAKQCKSNKSGRRSNRSVAPSARATA
jgi:hypothetical protein